MIKDDDSMVLSKLLHYAEEFPVLEPQNLVFDAISFRRSFSNSRDSGLRQQHGNRARDRNLPPQSGNSVERTAETKDRIKRRSLSASRAQSETSPRPSLEQSSFSWMLGHEASLERSDATQSVFGKSGPAKKKRPRGKDKMAFLFGEPE